MSNPDRFDVVGLGQCSFDILGRLQAFPAVDQKTELNQLDFQGGGPVATALVALARYGVPVAFLGRTGSDDYGQQIRAGLWAEKVDCRALLVDEGKTSQVAFIAVDGKGHRNIFWHRGTARPLTADEVDVDLVRKAKVLHLDGLHREASLYAAQNAREIGAVTVLDGGTLRDGSQELLPYIDHPVVSEKFAEQLLPGDSIVNQLEALLDHGAQAVTVTCGEKGSWTRERGGEPFHQPAFNVEALDTTGCGDVFHGAYIYGLLQGWDLRQTVRFSAAAAALKSRRLGGRTGIVSISDVNSMLSSI